MIPCLYALKSHLKIANRNPDVLLKTSLLSHLHEFLFALLIKQHYVNTQRRRQSGYMSNLCAYVNTEGRLNAKTRS